MLNCTILIVEQDSSVYETTEIVLEELPSQYQTFDLAPYADDPLIKTYIDALGQISFSVLLSIKQSSGQGLVILQYS